MSQTGRVNKKESSDSFFRLEEFLLFKNTKTRNSQADKLAGDYLNNKKNLFQKLSFKDSLNSITRTLSSLI